MRWSGIIITMPDLRAASSNMSGNVAMLVEGNASDRFVKKATN